LGVSVSSIGILVIIFTGGFAEVTRQSILGAINKSKASPEVGEDLVGLFSANNGALLSSLRVCIGGFCITGVMDIIIAWALWIAFRPVNDSLAFLSSWLRVSYALLELAAVSSSIGMIPRLVTGSMIVGIPNSEPNTTGGHATDEKGFANREIALLLDKFEFGWNVVALAVFGLHLMALGVVVWQSNPCRSTGGYTQPLTAYPAEQAAGGGAVPPKWLAVTVVIAGVSYLTDSIGHMLWDQSSTLAFTAHGGFLGEVFLLVWLLVRGGKIEVKTWGQLSDTSVEGGADDGVEGSVDVSARCQMP
jgi:hypothetical protein